MGESPSGLETLWRETWFPRKAIKTIIRPLPSRKYQIWRVYCLEKASENKKNAGFDLRFF